MFSCRISKVNILKSIQNVEVRLHSATPAQNFDGETKTFTNEDIKPVQTLINRNERSLERIAYAHQDIGWGAGYSDATNYPSRQYYHRICLERTSKHTYAWLEHYNGREIIKISTRDWLIRKHLYKATDVTACAALGSILVEMCIRAGISCAAFLPPSSESEAQAAFRTAIEKTGFSLQEPEQVLRKRLPHEKVAGPKPLDIF